MTSHDVVRRVRRLAGTRKVGHAGTLDPLATGVLPVAIGDGTKVLQFLLAENKSYRATFQLGVTTDTLDREGEVISHKEVPAGFADGLDALCQRFRGDIEQLPPMYSALKKNGVPLYKLARAGQEVERELRSVRIDRLEILDIDGDKITIEVDCSKGTYIRSLVNDIGESVGCGACLTELRRLRSGDFAIDECATLDQLADVELSQHILSPAGALRSYPAVELSDDAVGLLTFGIPPTLEQVQTPDAGADLEPGQVTCLLQRGVLMAVTRFAPAREKEKRGDFEFIRVFANALKS